MFTYKPITLKLARRTTHLYHLTSKTNMSQIEYEGRIKGHSPTGMAELMMLFSKQEKAETKQIYFFRSLYRTFGLKRTAECYLKIRVKDNEKLMSLLENSLYRRIDDALIIETEDLLLSELNYEIINIRE